MKTEIVLEGIQPFNDFYFKTCFYNLLFTALNYIECDIIPVLINSVPVLELNRNEMQLECAYDDAMDLYSLMPSMAGEIHWINHCDNLEEYIVRSIEQGDLLIVHVDCFFQPHKKTVYLKEHWPHCVLVYGYNLNDRTYHIVDQEYHESLSYTHLTVSFTKLKNAYNGYLENFQKGRDIAMIFNINSKSVKKPAHTNSELFRILKDNYKKNSLRVNQSIENMKIFSEEITKVYPEPNKFLANVNNIVRTKEVIQYVLMQIADSPEIEKTNLLILEQWKSLRAVMAKKMFQNKSKEECFNSLPTQLTEIIKLEKHINELIFHS